MSTSVKESLDPIATPNAADAPMGVEPANAFEQREDRYTADCHSSIPSKEQIRALKTQLLTDSTAYGDSHGRRSNIDRFQGAGWTSQAALLQCGVGVPLRAVEKKPTVSATTAATNKDRLSSVTPESRAASTELWYAHAAIMEARLKSSQLSFRPLRKTS